MLNCCPFVKKNLTIAMGCSTAPLNCSVQLLNCSTAPFNCSTVPFKAPSSNTIQHRPNLFFPSYLELARGSMFALCDNRIAAVGGHARPTTAVTMFVGAARRQPQCWQHYRWPLPALASSLQLHVFTYSLVPSAQRPFSLVCECAPKTCFSIIRRSSVYKAVRSRSVVPRC